MLQGIFKTCSSLFLLFETNLKLSSTKLTMSKEKLPDLSSKIMEKVTLLKC